MINNLHVGGKSPHLPSSTGVVNKQRAVRYGACPGEGLLKGGVEVVGGVDEGRQLEDGNDDHHEGGRLAAELLNKGKHTNSVFECGFLFSVEAVLPYYLCT